MRSYVLTIIIIMQRLTRHVSVIRMTNRNNNQLLIHQVMRSGVINHSSSYWQA